MLIHYQLLPVYRLQEYIYLYLYLVRMDSEIKSTRTTENMGHITPNQYSKSNLAHYNINKTAANNFVSIHPALGSQDR